MTKIIIQLVLASVIGISLASMTHGMDWWQIFIIGVCSAMFTQIYFETVLND